MGKSEPDVYFEAARRLGAEPNNIAVFEDALFAARTAKNAGFYVVAVYDENAKRNWEKLVTLADESMNGEWL